MNVIRALAAAATAILALGGVALAGPDIERGRALYERQCAACHGVAGRGDGPAAYLLFPKPRNFARGTYRFVSTWEHVPTDDDLLAVITRGIPGSSMPAWGHLPESDRHALVAYVKSLSNRDFTIVPTSAPVPDEGTPGTGVLMPPAEGEYDPARGRELFADACASCHGPEGKGDGDQPLVDADGWPIRPRDLTSGVFKSAPTPEQLYRRIILGIPGTPMPVNDWAWGQDGWHLVRFVLSLSSPVQRERAEMVHHTIRASRVARVPDHPDDGAWAAAPPVHLHLMPLWWRYARPEEVVVRALHDGRALALLLVWTDASHDETAMRPQDFRDAAAVQFALGDDDPPFFAMGERAAPVNIWMWKAERQADLEPAFQDLERIYPNLGIDSYPNPLLGPLEQPHRHALTVDASPLFVTAWGAGNIVADPTRRSAVEDLRAQGFGTLRARPPVDRAVSARGTWEFGSYRVLLRRDLKVESPDAVRPRPGGTVPVAFAIWDGSAGDHNGQKSVTIWQRLALER